MKRPSLANRRPTHFTISQRTLYLYPTPDDQYGNDFRVTQDVSKEAREAGVRGAILGNAKFAGQKPQGEHISRPKPTQKEGF